MRKWEDGGQRPMMPTWILWVAIAVIVLILVLWTLFGGGR